MNRSTIDAVKSAAWTALFAFLGPFGLALLGWLNDVGRWASDHGRTPFPDFSSLGYAAVAAAVAASAFVVNLVVRLAQAKGALPGEPPVYPATSNEAGHTTLDTACLVVIAVVAVIALFAGLPID